MLAAAVLALALLVMLGADARAQTSPPPSPSPGAPASGGPQNQLTAVTLARGVKADSVFGQGAVTPVEPTMSFISTDVPYAIVKVKSLVPDTLVTLRIIDPTGSEFSVAVKAPHRNNVWQDFDFALPVYILGTAMEERTGTWHFQVAIGDTPPSDTTFDWQKATPLALSQIKDAVQQTPLNADLHWRYGAALAQLGHDSEAIQELQAAIHLDSRYALYHITLGRIYEREGRQADAVREYQTALSLHGSYYDAVFAKWAQAGLARLNAH